MKISAKEIDLLVWSLMPEIYDYDYINKVRDEKAEEAWKEFAKLPRVKEIKKILENPYVHTIDIKESIFDETPAEVKKAYVSSNYISSLQSLKNLFKWRVSGKTKVDYPDSITVESKLRTLLTIECLWGSDLKKVLGEVVKTIKKEFKLK